MTDQNNTSKFTAQAVQPSTVEKKTITKADRDHAVLSLFGADTREGVSDRARNAIQVIARYDNDNLAAKFKKLTGVDVLTSASKAKTVATVTAGRMK